MHVHVSCPDGEAKFWLEPEVCLVVNHGMRSQQLTEVGRVVEERRDEIIAAWRQHFQS